MKELIEKILTDKKARNISVITVFLLTATITGQPWQS